MNIQYYFGKGQCVLYRVGRGTFVHWQCSAICHTEGLFKMNCTTTSGLTFFRGSTGLLVSFLSVEGLRSQSYSSFSKRRYNWKGLHTLNHVNLSSVLAFHAVPAWLGVRKPKLSNLILLVWPMVTGLLIEVLQSFNDVCHLWQLAYTYSLLFVMWQNVVAGAPIVRQ